jgi:ubiquinone/menaquinone biosynthesis C-methylase UbiE
MTETHRKPDCSGDRGRDGHHHQHGGKSSESRVDKTAILAALALVPGQIVLDAGCGNGYMAKAFSQAVGPGGRVHALDPDETAIAQLAREVVGTIVVPFVGDITRQTPLPEASVDLVYLSTVFHGFTAEQVAGFREEVCRILKPGGRLAVLEIVKATTPFGPPLELRYSPDELQQQLLPLTPRTTIAVAEHFYLQQFEKQC